MLDTSICYDFDQRHFFNDLQFKELSLLQFWLQLNKSLL